jgi:hypothetical protein
MKPAVCNSRVRGRIWLRQTVQGIVMKTTALALALMFVSTGILADERMVDADPEADFSALHTFRLGQGQLLAKSPELSGPLVRKKIDAGIRAALQSHDLQEAGGQPDVVVTWRFGAANKREVESWPVGRWGRGRAWSVYAFTEGTLVIDMYRRPGRDLVWRGIYRDDERNPSKISARLVDDINKLFKDYPPKKKK